MSAAGTPCSCSSGRLAFGGFNYGRTFKYLDDIEISKSNNRNVVQSSGTEKRATSRRITVRTSISATGCLTPRTGFNFLHADTVDEEARHTTYDYLSTPAGDTLEKWQLLHRTRDQQLPVSRQTGTALVADSQLDWVINQSRHDPDRAGSPFRQLFPRFRRQPAAW